MIDLSTEEGQTQFIQKMKEEVFDFNHPAGYNYPQYPGAKSPVEMGWRGIWKLMYETENCHFTTEGSESPEFDGTGEFVEYYGKSKNVDEEAPVVNKRSFRIWVRTE